MSYEHTWNECAISIVSICDVDDHLVVETFEFGEKSID